MAMMPAAYVPMGITAENVAKRYGITRAMQDEFALESHKRATHAIEKGWFKDEIVPIKTSVFEDGGIKRALEFSTDEGPRADTTIEALTKLRPVFDKDGTVTAGNASQISDGAAACVLMDADEAQKLRLPIMGYFRAFATAGVPPELMGIGPVPAILKLMYKTGLKTNMIDVFEINEAFAAQAVYCIKELGLDKQKVNPSGGAIALGHPLGCTGARQIATILRELKRTNGKYGVVSMCIGGGMGAAGLIEV
jgi:acetyl-CoA acyltransferase